MIHEISDETAAFFMSLIIAYEPYPLSVLDELKYDDNRFDDRRLDATFCLELLLKAGYSEEEINPWMKGK